MKQPCQDRPFIDQNTIQSCPSRSPVPVVPSHFQHDTSRVLGPTWCTFRWGLCHSFCVNPDLSNNVQWTRLVIDALATSTLFGFLGISSWAQHQLGLHQQLWWQLNSNLSCNHAINNNWDFRPGSIHIQMFRLCFGIPFSDAILEEIHNRNRRHPSLRQYRWCFNGEDDYCGQDSAIQNYWSVAAFGCKFWEVFKSHTCGGSYIGTPFLEHLINIVLPHWDHNFGHCEWARHTITGHVTRGNPEQVCQWLGIHWRKSALGYDIDPMAPDMVAAEFADDRSGLGLSDCSVSPTSHGWHPTPRLEDFSGGPRQAPQVNHGTAFPLVSSPMGIHRGQCIV